MSDIKYVEWYDDENAFARTRSMQWWPSTKYAPLGTAYTSERKNPGDVWPPVTDSGKMTLSAARAIARNQGLTHEITNTP